MEEWGKMADLSEKKKLDRGEVDRLVQEIEESDRGRKLSLDQKLILTKLI